MIPMTIINLESKKINAISSFEVGYPADLLISSDSPNWRTLLDFFRYLKVCDE